MHVHVLHANNSQAVWMGLCLGNVLQPREYHHQKLTQSVFVEGAATAKMTTCLWEFSDEWPRFSLDASIMIAQKEIM